MVQTLVPNSRNVLEQRFGETIAAEVGCEVGIGTGIGVMHRADLDDGPTRLFIEFDNYEGEELDMHAFVRYRGEVYDPAEFLPVPCNTCAPEGIEQLQAWDGYQPDSYFSGLVLRYVEDCEQAVVGTYYAMSDCS
jgi:hypothetical protein